MDNNNVEDDDIIIDDELKEFFATCEPSDITFTHAYLPYSHWRIKEIFLAMDIELRPYFTGYKAMRYQSCQRYMLHDIYTNEIIGDERGYTLESLRYVLAQAQIPLHGDEKKEAYHKDTITIRRTGCLRFLKALEAIERNSGNGNTE